MLVARGRRRCQSYWVCASRTRGLATRAVLRTPKCHSSRPHTSPPTTPPCNESSSTEGHSIDAVASSNCATLEKLSRVIVALERKDDGNDDGGRPLKRGLDEAMSNGMVESVSLEAKKTRYTDPDENTGWSHIQAHTCLYLQNMVNPESLPKQLALRSRLLSVSGISEMSSVEEIDGRMKLVDRLLIRHGTNTALVDIRDEVSQWAICSSVCARCWLKIPQLFGLVVDKSVKSEIATALLDVLYHARAPPRSKEDIFSVCNWVRQNVFCSFPHRCACCSSQRFR